MKPLQNLETVEFPQEIFFSRLFESVFLNDLQKGDLGNFWTMTIEQNLVDLERIEVTI